MVANISLEDFQFSLCHVIKFNILVQWWCEYSSSGVIYVPNAFNSSVDKIPWFIDHSPSRAGFRSFISLLGEGSFIIINSRL